jgi:hypothetical protein
MKDWKSVNLWRVVAAFCAGMCLITLLLFGRMKAFNDNLYDIAVRQQTEIIDVQADIIRKQQEEIFKLRFGDNVTPPKPLPPGAPV